MSEVRILRFKCDNPSCGKEQDFNLQGLTPAQEFEISQWTLLGRQWVSPEGQIIPLARHACKEACIKAVIEAGKLTFKAARKDSAVAPGIDMNAIKNSADGVN